MPKTLVRRDPRVDPEYGVEEECLSKGPGDLGGAYIVRLPCGPTHKYIRRAAAWRSGTVGMGRLGTR